MSIVGAIRNFKVTLAQTAPMATARNACRRFNSWFSNFMNKPLQLRSAKVVQKPKKPETPRQIKINQNGSVVEFIDSLVGHV